MRNSFYALGTICLIIAMLYMGKVFLIPLTLSIFFWLIMSYQSHKLTKKFSNSTATYIVIGIYTVLLGVVIYGLGSSATYVREHISSLTTQIQESYTVYEEKVESTTFVTSQDIETLKEQGKEFLSLDMLGGIATGTLTGMTTGILIMVLSILMLLNENRILHTIKSMYGDEGIEVVLISRKTVAQYCLGLAMLILILFILNGIGLLILGVPYAFLIAAISAGATLVPTIGTFIGGIFATLVGGFLTSSIWVGLGIMARYLFIQHVEEFFILPHVVGKRVSLNTLTSLISLFARGLLRGVAGLFLAIPIMGVIQKIGEKHKKSYATLMGNNEIK